MADAYRPPALSAMTFTCPHCGVLALHAWNVVDEQGSNRVMRSLCRNPDCEKITL